jgi:cob(I)alamin adenosyltransferase
MKIATKSGDKGKTGRLFGSRVSKTDPTIEAVGDIDELNAAIGVAKAEIFDHEYFTTLNSLQHTLTLFMGEVAAEKERREEYVAKYDYVTQDDLDHLDHEVEILEKMPELEQEGWILYGNSRRGSLLDMASKVCRRAERSFLYAVQGEDDLLECRPLLLKYINRLSDFLHLLARYFDFLDN